jgi:hypothetical protein
MSGITYLKYNRALLHSHGKTLHIERYCFFSRSLETVVYGPKNHMKINKIINVTEVLKISHQLLLREDIKQALIVLYT